MYNAVPEAPMHDSEKSLAKRIAEISPTVSFRASVDSYGPGGDKDYMKERHARVKKEVEVIEDQIANWDAEAVAAQALKSLKAELAHKKASLIECEAEMDMNNVDYGQDDEDAGSEEDEGKIVAEGNPYKVMRDGGEYKVINSESGHVKGKHKTKGKAMRQFRKLEMIYHQEDK